MIDKAHFNILNYVKKEEYSGSMDGMRYMIKRVPGEQPADTGTDESAKEVEVPDRIKVTIWPEPLGIQATADELKTVEYFTLDKDGISDVADWLNKQYFDRMDEWNKAKEHGCNLP
ncbi:MAG: GNAT family acetyltransferase [Lachnospiraceae bacterium]|nr:GNAT family acetyltransferase [Lachnospiraceae bacterium]